MNFDSYLGHQTPPPDSSCRRENARLNSKAGETKVKGQASKLAKDARQRRVELRRIRSVSQAKSAADPSSSSCNNFCLDKKIDEVQNVTIEGTPEGLAADGAVTGGARGSTLRCRSYGKISVVGRRRDMGDVVAAELGFLQRGEESYDFFGVYDGHGGWRVAHTCGQMLHKMVAKIVEEESGEEIDWEEVMAAGFNMMDAMVNKNAVAAAAAAAAVAVVGENEVVVANGGGSRVVLSRGGAAVQLLEDHKIVKRGARHPMNPLAITEAKVRVSKRSDKDEFFIMGSDGFWDVVSDELACRVARRCLVEEGDHGIRESGGAEAAAALLAELAMARGSRDNISIIVVDLKEVVKSA